MRTTIKQTLSLRGSYRRPCQLADGIPAMSKATQTFISRDPREAIGELHAIRLWPLDRRKQP